MLKNCSESGKLGVSSIAATLMWKTNFFTKNRPEIRFARAAEHPSKLAMAAAMPPSGGYTMYDQLLPTDFALSLIILFSFLAALVFVMKILTKVKRRRNRRAIEYGIKDLMRHVRG